MIKGDNNNYSGKNTNIISNPFPEKSFLLVYMLMDHIL
uniref:Uncharacterized protein n=1 Tax=Lepeophtheirus salmonis TaxID=72036 RepID=A0A0K2T0J9_LEPSM